LARIKLKCHACGARITPSDYIGRSFDMSTSFYRCHVCGTVIAVKDLGEGSGGG